MKKIIAIISISIITGLIVGGIYYFIERLPSKQNQVEIKTTRPPCLLDNEKVDYDINWRQTVGPVDIVMKDKESEREIYKFTIESVLYAAYPIQPRKCGVYALRIFDYDPADIIKSASENKYEIWHYVYDGEGQILFSLGRDFNLEFKVDFLEAYLALIKGYLGQTDFAIVIKEIATNNDVFSLEHKDIISKYPGLIGVFGLDGWTKNSRYLWGRISYGANILGFFRIERDAWKVDIFPLTERILGGTAFNLEYGYVTFDTGPGWIGIHEVAEQVYDEWRRQGKIVELYVYNLFTQEKFLVATSSDPSWHGTPRWRSDTELEYSLPSGEKKIYKISEK